MSAAWRVAVFEILTRCWVDAEVEVVSLQVAVTSASLLVTSALLLVASS